MPGNKEQNGSDPPNGTTVAEVEGAFENFAISAEMVAKLKDLGINYLFPIQSQTFDFVAGGDDVIAQARTGTGKTLSFSLPLAEMLLKRPKPPKAGRKPRVLVMAPTRELARQVAENFQLLMDEKTVLCIYGGTPYGPQERQLRQGVDVVVGTPGRIKDLIQKETLNLGRVKHVVLDEVDHMLDMGFRDIVDEILQKLYNRENESKKPQTLLFSATLPTWVHQTAQKYMKDCVKKVNLTDDQKNRTSTTVEHLAIKCSYYDRASTVGAVVGVYSGMHGRAMVFCQTKRDADELAVSPDIKSQAHVLHGDIPQDKREMVLKGFRDGKYKVLITTDVAARGLDIPEVDLVVQCSAPQDVDAYIHRSGRTGRAGRPGVCVCFYKPREDYTIQQVEQRAGIKFRRIGPPTAKDITKAAAKDAMQSLAKVPSETLEHFRNEAVALIEQRGAEDALAAALAVISGSTTIIHRSLLCSKEGFTTYLFSTNINMYGAGYVWKALEQLGELKDKVVGMRLCSDRKSAVFDLPSELEEQVSTLWKDGQYDALTKAEELPELLEYENNHNGGGGNFHSRGGRGGRGHGGFGRGGGFRGRGNGFQRQSYNSNGYQNGSGGTKRKFNGNSGGNYDKRGKH